MEIINSTVNDIATTFQLFDHAMAYQKRKGYQQWPKFSRELIETEIKEKRHWKIIDDGKIACVFSVMYNDPVIWGEMDKDPSVYLHRIAVNPEFKGKKIMTVIKQWALITPKRIEKNIYVWIPGARMKISVIIILIAALIISVSSNFTRPKVYLNIMGETS